MKDKKKVGIDDDLTVKFQVRFDVIPNDACAVYENVNRERGLVLTEDDGQLLRPKPNLKRTKPKLMTAMSASTGKRLLAIAKAFKRAQNLGFREVVIPITESGKVGFLAVG